MFLLSLAGHTSRYYKLTAMQFLTIAAAHRENYKLIVMVNVRKSETSVTAELLLLLAHLHIM